MPTEDTTKNFITTRTPGSRVATYGLADHVAATNPHPQYLLAANYKPGIGSGDLYHDYKTDNSKSHAASMNAVNGVYTELADHVKTYPQNAVRTSHRDGDGLELYAHRIHEHQDLDFRLTLLENNALMWAKHEFTDAIGSNSWMKTSDGKYKYDFVTGHFSSSHVYKLENTGSVVVDESVEVHIVGTTTADSTMRVVELIAMQPFSGYIITLGAVTPTELRYTLIEYPTGVTVGGKTYAAQVTGIKSNAANINTLFIPSNVTIDNVIYPVKSIGGYAFSGNSNIVEVSIADGIEEILVHAFHNCVNLRSIRFPNTLLRLYGGVLRGCDLITRLEFPQSLQRLETAWGYGLMNLEGVINIPSNVSYISNPSFTSTKITGFTVDSDNQYFEAVDGCLLSKTNSLGITGKKTLLLVPPAFERDTYTTPPEVVEVQRGCFTYCRIKELTFREGVVSAFESIKDAPVLTTVNIPASLEDNPFGSYLNALMLRTITVATGNKHFSVESTENGSVLFNVNKSTLVKYCNYNGGNVGLAWEVPSFVVILGKSSLSLCGLISLKLNEGLTTIQTEALRSVLGRVEINVNGVKVPHLGPLNIPSTLTTIADDGMLESFFSKFEISDPVKSNFAVDRTDDNPENNPEGLVLYNKGKTTAIVFTYDRASPDRVSITLPATVNTIGYGFAYNTDSLQNLNLSRTSITRLPPYTWRSVAGDTQPRSLTLPTSLTVIKREAIYLDNITSVTIPASVTTIESGSIGLVTAESITFEDRGYLNSNGTKVFNLTTYKNIFATIDRRCVIRGYGEDSPAKAIADEYSLQFDNLA